MAFFLSCLRLYHGVCAVNGICIFSRRISFVYGQYSYTVNVVYLRHLNMQDAMYSEQPLFKENRRNGTFQRNFSQ